MSQAPRTNNPVQPDATAHATTTFNIQSRSEQARVEAPLRSLLSESFSGMLPCGEEEFGIGSMIPVAKALSAPWGWLSGGGVQLAGRGEGGDVAEAAAMEMRRTRLKGKMEEEVEEKK